MAEPALKAVETNEVNVDEQLENLLQDLAKQNRTMASAVRQKTTYEEKVAELNGKMDDLTKELLGMANGKIKETDERKVFDVANDRNKVEKELDRYTTRAEVSAIVNEVQASIDILSNIKGLLNGDNA